MPRLREKLQQKCQAVLCTLVMVAAVGGWGDETFSGWYGALKAMLRPDRAHFSNPVFAQLYKAQHVKSSFKIAQVPIQVGRPLHEPSRLTCATDPSQRTLAPSLSQLHDP